MSKEKEYSVIKLEDKSFTYKNTDQLEKGEKSVFSTDDISEAIQDCNDRNGHPDHEKHEEVEEKETEETKE